MAITINLMWVSVPVSITTLYIIHIYRMTGLLLITSLHHVSQPIGRLNLWTFMKNSTGQDLSIACECVCVCAHTCARACVCTYTYVCIYVFIYIHVYMYQCNKYL